MRRYPLLFLLAGMITSLVAALLVLVLGLNPPADDLQQLALFMSASGGVTVGVAYLFYHLGLIRRLASLRWALLTTVVITVILVMLNVWFTAQLMFNDTHDLILTGSLLLFAGLTAVFVGLYVASTITSRIQDLSDAAEAIAAGKLDTRLTVKGGDELSQLATTFNWMADHLQKIDEQKRQIEKTRRDLIAWVSHDLRTPLTAIRANLEAVQDGIVTDPAKQSHYVERSLGEVENLNRLIDDLFELAKLDTGHTDTRLVAASLSDLISDVASSMMARAQQNNITLKGDIQPGIDPVAIAPDKIQRVLRNLIDNALRHTPEGGKITIQAYGSGRDGVTVKVHNTGPAIAPEHLPHLFTSFYRVEKSRQRDAGGQRSTGLGLAIARGFVEAHQGRIWATSTPEQGTAFCFTIPRLARAIQPEG